MLYYIFTKKLSLINKFNIELFFSELLTSINKYSFEKNKLLIFKMQA